MLADAMGLPGWSDYDLPRMSPEYMTKLIDIIGDGNIGWATQAQYTERDGSISQRGHILISPAGLENIREYRKLQGKKATQIIVDECE